MTTRSESNKDSLKTLLTLTIKWRSLKMSTKELGKIKNTFKRSTISKLISDYIKVCEICLNNKYDRHPSRPKI